MAPANQVQDIFNVKGLVAVITGGGTGLGAYAARALDANGAKKVYIIGRRKEALEATAKTGVNGTITPIVGDVTSKDSLTQITEQIRREEGYVNFLFANAGILGPTVRAFNADETSGQKPSPQDYQKKLWAAEPDVFNSTFGVNITGTYYTAVAFLDLLDAGNRAGNVAQDSQILVTSSVAGFSRQLAAGLAYSASKAGVNHLVKMLATLFAQQAFRIRVNLIAPGFYPSEMTSESLTAAQGYAARPGHEHAFEGARALPPDKSPSQRTGSEEDFAGTILFIASRAGAYVNGETLVTDGGRLAQLPSTY